MKKLIVVALLLATAGCGDDGIRIGALVTLQFESLRNLDPVTEGSYEAWLIQGSGAPVSLGRFQIPPGGHLLLPGTIDEGWTVMITVEPPGDEDDMPSDTWLLGGRLEGRTTELTIEGYVTAGTPLERDIGTHVLFTPANNAWDPYPSSEDAGIWVFNMHTTDNPMRREGVDMSSDFFLKSTPLREGWVYEGWIVYDYGLPNECWVSYGKWDSGPFNRMNEPDNTGFGPFSGFIDYVGNGLALLHNFPGDDWVENPYDLPVPCGLELPFDLNGGGPQNLDSRWTHVITIEPARDRPVESPFVDPAAPTLARPFLIQPYRNPFGEGVWDEPRVIDYNPDGIPRVTATFSGY